MCAIHSRNNRITFVVPVLSEETVHQALETHMHTHHLLVESVIFYSEQHGTESCWTEKQDCSKPKSDLKAWWRAQQNSHLLSSASTHKIQLRMSVMDKMRSNRRVWRWNGDRQERRSQIKKQVTDENQSVSYCSCSSCSCSASNDSISKLFSFFSVLFFTKKHLSPKDSRKTLRFNTPF